MRLKHSGTKCFPGSIIEIDLYQDPGCNQAAGNRRSGCSKQRPSDGPGHCAEIRSPAAHRGPHPRHCGPPQPSPPAITSWLRLAGWPACRLYIESGSPTRAVILRFLHRPQPDAQLTHFCSGRYRRVRASDVLSCFDTDSIAISSNEHKHATACTTATSSQQVPAQCQQIHWRHPWPKIRPPKSRASVTRELRQQCHLCTYRPSFVRRQFLRFALYLRTRK